MKLYATSEILEKMLTSEQKFIVFLCVHDKGLHHEEEGSCRPDEQEDV